MRFCDEDQDMNEGLSWERDPRVGRSKTGKVSISISVFLLKEKGQKLSSWWILLNFMQLKTWELLSFVLCLYRKCPFPAVEPVAVFRHKTPSFVSVTTGNADISYYPSPLSVSDGKRGPPGAHYRSCQMIGAAWRSHGTHEHVVSAATRRQQQMAWVPAAGMSVIPQREGEGSVWGREKERRAERSTGKEEAADFRGDTWENAHCILTGGWVSPRFGLMVKYCCYYFMTV